MSDKRQICTACGFVLVSDEEVARARAGERVFGCWRGRGVDLRPEQRGRDVEVVRGALVAARERLYVFDCQHRALLRRLAEIPGVVSDRVASEEWLVARVERLIAIGAAVERQFDAEARWLS